MNGCDSGDFSTNGSFSSGEESFEELSPYRFPADPSNGFFGGR
jgi:hypothetical protein